MPETPLILLDRDGTIIEDKHYLHDPEGVELVSGAAEGLRRMKENGWRLAIVSNQSGVGRGYFTDADVRAVNERMAEFLAPHGVELDAFYHCPHAPSEECDCRKPEPGMAERALADFAVPPSRCAVIGDKPCDVNLGKTVGALSILVRTGKGAASEGQCEPDYTADTLEDAAAWLETRFTD